MNTGRMPKALLVIVGGGIYLLTVAGFVVGGWVSLHPPEIREDLSPNPFAAGMCFFIAGLLAVIPAIYALVRWRQTATLRQDKTPKPGKKKR